MHIFKDQSLNRWRLITESLPDNENELNALKKTALTVGNPSLRFEIFGGLEIRWRGATSFLKWPGSYKVKQIPEIGEMVAIIILPNQA